MCGFILDEITTILKDIDIRYNFDHYNLSQELFYILFLHFTILDLRLNYTLCD